MKYFLIGMAIIIILLSVNNSFSIAETVSINLDDHVSDDIIDLGILLYSDTVEKVLTVQIYNCTDEIILSYLFSDINISALSIESSWYSLLENKTTIIFKTSKIIPEWYFKNNTRQFIYMDNNNKILFRVYINYSNIILPENPLDLLINQNNVISENLSIIWEDYNITYETLNITCNTLFKKWNLLNITYSKLDQLNETNKQLTIDNDNLEIAFLDKKNESDKYKAWYNTKKKDYNSLFKKAQSLNDELGKWPIYIVCAVILTAFLIFLLDRRRGILKKRYPKETDINDISETGLTKKAKFINRLFRKNKKSSESQDIETSSKDNIPEQISKNPSNVDQKFNEIQSRIDAVIKETHNLDSKFTKDIQNINQKIDKFLSKKIKKVVT